MIRPEVMQRILVDYELPGMGLHGLAHWGRVLETGLRLDGSTGADPAVVRLFAVFHDARRWNEHSDPGHGGRGAELAFEMRPLLDVSDAQLQLLAIACRHHTDGRTQGDPTVQTCWDADRLDLWRVGIEPLGTRLCTEAARQESMLEWSRVRSESDLVPDCAREWSRWAAGGS